MKVVLDTNVLVSAFLWDNSLAKKILHRLLAIDAEIYISEEIILEFQRVLKRDFETRDERIIYFMKQIFLYMKVIKPAIMLDIIKEDPDDNKIIECAVDSYADFILSYDPHLLKLQEYAGIKIVRPDRFLSFL